MTDSLKHLSQRQHEFALQRGWIPLNSPRNLACALMVEAAELLEHFQWMKKADSFTLPCTLESSSGSSSEYAGQSLGPTG